MLEYFIATPGARKGLVDTALRTADSGYLTRRLVDVAQELIINDERPVRGGGPVRGIWIEDVEPDRPGKRDYLENRLYSRTLADDVDASIATARCINAGEAPSSATSTRWSCSATTRTSPGSACCRRSPTTRRLGISGASYGLSLATGKTIEVGEAVGVIAAQSIGEPGTQLTMRTFHTGGIAGAAGHRRRSAPRRRALRGPQPEGQGHPGPHVGHGAHRRRRGQGPRGHVVADDGTEDAYTVPSARPARGHRRPGDPAGDPIVEGPRDPKELIEIKGVRETQCRGFRFRGVPENCWAAELEVPSNFRNIASTWRATTSGTWTGRLMLAQIN